MQNNSTKYIPKSEHFFFVPVKQKLIEKTHIVGSSLHQHMQKRSIVLHSEEIVLYWCEYNDGTFVKSYPIKILNIPNHEFDFSNRQPYYHQIYDSNFEQASANIIKDFSNVINLFYTCVRPDLVSEDMLIAPERAMEHLINFFLKKS